MGKVAPCKNCGDRAVGCHGVCKDYNDWALETKKAGKWAKAQNFVVYNSQFTGTSPKPGHHRSTRRGV